MQHTELTTENYTSSSVQGNPHKDSEEICQNVNKGSCLELQPSFTFFIVFFMLFFFMHFFKKMSASEYILLREKVSYHKHTHERDGGSETVGGCCKGGNNRSLEQMSEHK